MVRIYRSGLYRMASGHPFRFWSLDLPDTAFSTEDGLLRHLAKIVTREQGHGHASRAGYPVDFIGPLPGIDICERMR